ncbi:MAG: hypothetical protein A3F10_07180 [Coxiella sp. RIFCSPHIGHO2_12_FULL_42_15]|nr:MAG: hypothetical protein A3F10_07180 [Coxiella sp. RIFCSPHIGHO2_12_FULL_42_15]
MKVDGKAKEAGWRIPVLLIWMIAALGVPYQFVLQSTPNVMIPMLMQDLHISEASIGFLTSDFFYTYLLFQIPAGLLIDRFGVRVVLSGSLLLAAMACFLFASAHHFALASLSRLLMGLVTAPCVPAIMYVACNRFSPRHFVILAGLAESIGMLGGAVGEALLGEVVTGLGWRETMLTCTIVGVVVAFLMVFFIRDTESNSRGSTEGPSFKDILRGFLEVMQNPQIWFIVLFAGLIFALLPALAGLWIVQALQDLYHVNIKIAALGSSMLFLGTALGLPVWGFFSEKIQRRKPVMFFATMLSLLFTSGFIYWPHLPLVFVFLVLFLMGFMSAVYVLAFALVREHTSIQVRASAMGLTNMMSMIIGAPLLQPLIGVILDHHADHASFAYHRAFSSIVLCLILAILSLFFIRETYCGVKI